MALKDPDYWLEKYLSQADCGSRNRSGYLLAAQLRDNGVGKNTAKETMKRFARQVPDCDHPYRESQAIKTLYSVYSREPREPCEVEEDSNGLKERAREKERELLEQFKKDPLSLTKMERKRLSQSDVHSLPLEIYEVELAKRHMTRRERNVFFVVCSTEGRRYSVEGEVEPNSICECGCAEFRFRDGDSFRKPKTTMIVDFDEATSEALRDVADDMILAGLERRSKYIDEQR